MTVLDRSELQASPLADLHVIADQVGLDGFRRLRKADLIDAILGEGKDGDGAENSDGGPSAGEPTARAGSRRTRSSRLRRGGGGGGGASKPSGDEDERVAQPASDAASAEGQDAAGGRDAGSTGRRGRARGEREQADEPERVADGVVEVLGNGSAFLRVEPPEPSDGDVYVSAAQVRRCELVSGDRVSGPVRTPRRSERYPSLIRIDTINGAPADSVSEGTRYDELAVSYPSERLTLGYEDATLQAIERLTPLGLGSRAVIAGAARSGKTETLRRILGALAGREGIELTLVLAGVRPEEIADWRQGSVAPTGALTFAASAEAQGRVVETAVETAKRIAARGGDAVVLIDGLDGLHPHTARKALAAARNLTDGGSLTVIATATQPFGGESSVIALGAPRPGTGAMPALDPLASGTLRPQLLVGEEGAEAIERERERAAAR